MAKRGFRVMDSDLHTIEPDDLWQRYLEEPFKKFDPATVRTLKRPAVHTAQAAIGERTAKRESVRGTAGLHPRLSSRHPPYAAAAARGYDAESHLQAMDIEGVDVAILFGTRGRHVLMHDDLDPALAAALARAHNNWTHDYCMADAGRLKFAAQISLHDAGLAVTEVRRAVQKLGAVAVIGNPNPVNGRHIHDPYFESLWDAIEEVEVPVCFHPTGVWSLRDNIARRFLGHPNGREISTAVHNPIEVMLAFASLACGGVLERHPKLHCAFLEGTCGWLPWWLWRIDETWERFGNDAEVRLGQLPSQYFFRQCFIATDPNEKLLRQVVEAVGDDNIVVSTDYPHRDSLFPEAINRFLSLEGVSDRTKAKVLWDNCARLYPSACSGLSPRTLPG